MEEFFRTFVSYDNRNLDHVCVWLRCTIEASFSLNTLERDESPGALQSSQSPEQLHRTFPPIAPVQGINGSQHLHVCGAVHLNNRTRER